MVTLWPCKPYPKQHRQVRALCYVCSTESQRWQRALWQHKAKIDDCSRQNPAYSPDPLLSLSLKRESKQREKIFAGTFGNKFWFLVPVKETKLSLREIKSQIYTRIITKFAAALRRPEKEYLAYF